MVVSCVHPCAYDLALNMVLPWTWMETDSGTGEVSAGCSAKVCETAPCVYKAAMDGKALGSGGTKKMDSQKIGRRRRRA